jgi:hypothetical protein
VCSLPPILHRSVWVLGRRAVVIAVSGARANNGPGQGSRAGETYIAYCDSQHCVNRRVLPGRVDQLLPVSRQKSSNFPYLDMAGYSQRSLAFNNCSSSDRRARIRIAEQCSGSEWIWQS